MNAFEIAFALMTVITSLALVHLLEGFVSLQRNASRVRFSMAHRLWTWISIAVLIGICASIWSMLNVLSWPSIIELLILTIAPLEYAFCGLEITEMPMEEELNHGEFYSSSNRL